MCSDELMLINGMISYVGDDDDAVPYDYNTMATHTCNEGFFMASGNSQRTCGDGEGVNGEWSGMAPMCTGNALF